MSSELKNIIKNVTVYKVKVTKIRSLKTINGILSYKRTKIKLREPKFIRNS